MAKFIFRLRALRRVRELHRDAARLRLAQAIEAREILAQRRQALSNELMQQRRTQRELCSGQVLDVHQVLQAQRYQMALSSQGDQLEAQAGKVREEVELRRQAAVEADQQVRLLDELEERQLAEHRRAQATQETKRLDEVGATRRGGVL